MKDPLNSRAPAFQWYPADYMSDVNVQLMDWPQRGIYTWLLGICWLEKTIPSDLGSLAKLTHTSVEWWEQNGAGILVCFKPIIGGKLINSRIEKERAKQRAYRESKQRAGEIGAKNRWKSGSVSNNKNNNLNASAMRLPLANDSSSSSSSSSDTSAIASVPPKSPKGDLCEIGKKCNGKSVQCGQYFELFWSSYPRHDPPRKQSRKSWCSQFSSGLEIEGLLRWIGIAKQRWTDKKFIPMPTTWLNQRRWEGDLPPETNLNGPNKNASPFNGPEFNPDDGIKA